jgi:hypothetical protein
MASPPALRGYCADNHGLWRGAGMAGRSTMDCPRILTCAFVVGSRPVARPAEGDHM